MTVCVCVCCGQGLKNTGLWKNDPRLRESMAKVRQAVSDATAQDLEGKEVLLDRDTFKE